MILNKSLDDDTILYYLEAHSTLLDGNNLVVDSYLLAFGFYDCHYDVYVTKKDIMAGIPFTKINGDTALLKLFLVKCVEDLWDIIIDACIDYDVWFSSLDNKN